MPETDLLASELAAYDQHRDELLGRAVGKFVLIHGDDVIGVYETKQDGIVTGYTSFGNEPFLVKQIGDSSSFRPYGGPASRVSKWSALPAQAAG